MNNTISDGGGSRSAPKRDPRASSIFEPFQYLMAREEWVPLRLWRTLDDAGRFSRISRGIVSMATFMSCRWLLPEGLVVESIRREADSITVAARSAAGDAACPSRGGRSRRVHRRYHRGTVNLSTEDRERWDAAGPTRQAWHP